ncbi:hypothetical protein [Herbidospora cretacea]|uniref:hypothetical protein n=1 Tax=Herbidospora cretacea TaxID=28444 RepID=UPI000774548D|nr:hypothetical protein [Herbidospora cretacea]
MNDVISRLKDATAAAGETISAVSELRLERARKPFLTPVVAALAVGVAIIGTVVGTRGALDQTVATTTAPRFIVETRTQSALIVRGVADGAEIDRVGADGGWTYGQVHAAPDNRTFYATMSGPGFCTSKIVRFSVDGDGQAGPPAELPVRPPDGNRFSAFTVSGDGTKVVFGAVPCAADATSAGLVVVADVQSGTAQTLSAGPAAGFTSISTNEDGSKIAYLPMTAGGPFTIISEPGSTADIRVFASPSPGAVSEEAEIVPSPASPQADAEVRPPSPTIVPSAPQDTLRSFSSCRFHASQADGRISDTQSWTLDCPDSSEVYMVDTARPGAAPRRLELSAQLDGAKVEVYGVRMSADGTRLIAGVGTGTARLDDPEAAIMAFDASDGSPVETLYQGRGWIRLLDLAAGGAQMLVQNELEIGVVSGNAYRKVVDIPGRVMDGVVAW